MYWVISFYHFFSLEDPEKEARVLRKYFSNKDFKGRIYLSKEGINAQLSGEENQAKAWMQWIQQRDLYTEISLKIQTYPEHAFYKMQVKVREQLVALDQKVDLDQRGQSLTPKKWKEKLEAKEPNTLLIDVRNRYESEVGHFEGAELPDCENFREFPKYTEKLLADKDPKTTEIMMYCTGGIRCEYYSSFLKSKGFQKVYQLQGGIIQYGQEQGKAHWKGKLFVFDDRLVVPICEQDPCCPISQCQHCKKSCDTYYNCANMDCNELFVACRNCSLSYEGCCCSLCQRQGRVRPFDSSLSPKPFRKKSKAEKQKLLSSSSAENESFIQ